MCIVVDANVSHKMAGDHPDGSCVLRWLLYGRGKLVVSEEILAELVRTPLSTTILVLDQAGKICRVDEDDFTRYKEQVINSGMMVSNDPHILAVILTSQCDLVFSNDKPLHRDLKNRHLVPDVSIYQTARHKKLLGECRC